MSNRKVLIIVGVIVAVLVVTIAVQFFKVKSVMAEGMQVIVEAQHFGKSATDVQCVDEAIDRFEACDDEVCRMMATPFASNCLFESRKTSELCGGVPSLYGGDQGESWRRKQCGEVIGGMASEEACTGIFFVVQANCQERK
jgi:hypothetical protein